MGSDGDHDQPSSTGRSQAVSHEASLILDATHGLLSFYILSLLMNSEMYGQQLGAGIRKLRGDSRKLGPGTLYPALGRLRRKGLIASLREGRRKIHRITDEARRGFEEVRRILKSILEEALS